MSEENVEALRSAVDAINRGDIEAALELVDPDIEWQTELIGTPVYRGHEGARQGFRDVMTAWESWQMEPIEFLEGDDHVFMAVHVNARGRTTGATVEARVFYVLDFRHGKVVRFQGFTQRSQALEAAGLSE